MKKTLSAILALVLLLSLAACAGGTPAKEQPATTEGLAADQLLVGYGKVNITPDISLPLQGYGNTDKRMSTGFMDYLYATCFAVTDSEGNTAILFGIDMCGTGAKLYETAREEISDKYNVPMERVVISASHNHSSPDMGNTAVPSVNTWKPKLIKLLVECADMAMEDRAPAQMSVASAQTKGLNFVRRYKLEDGSVMGYASLITASGLKEVGHETDADPELQLLKFDREEKADILVANFQTHPHRGGSANNTSMTADLVGAFRTEIENKLGYQVVYFTGASGNINPTSRIKEENITGSFQEQGQALAQYAIDAEGTYTAVAGGPVRGKVATYTGMIDHSEDHLLAIAKEAQALWKETNDIMTVTNAYLDQGIKGPYHAGAIVSKAGLEESKSFDIYAVSFGDIGLAAAPYEMFDTNGVYIKENSPFAMTLVAECANGSNGYIPSAIAWDNRGYEVDTCRFQKGIGEGLAEQYVQMLTELKG